ncbi:regulatory protein, tetR family [Amycolatopsis arida]|uniref:Regulatory protein, tetR family n=1 Tax=Amycolatopsis arida TaxID=587909 RepID=A0A1I5Q6T6_9PSEU|nr:TetR/AcrR family transcriptional regulator C-terminal domain-containing protein [Amycolatopsis arida]TDX98727.1 regulatory TetR family protein [Amycolatopsis arida]SFP41576.1 regulatory protein, tetR family [Amycolatopsis arida]
MAAAIDLAQREGLEALSMRRLAGVLGVAPMSLYNYVAGRDELEMLMMRAAFAANPLPDARPMGWRTTIEVVYRLQWQLYRTHRWLAEVLSVTRPPLAPEAMRYSEWTLEALAEVGLKPAERVHATIALAGLTKGLALGAIGELRAEDESRLRNSQWWLTSDAEAATVLATGAYPRLSEIADLVPATGLDSLDEAFHHLSKATSTTWRPAQRNDPPADDRSPSSCVPFIEELGEPAVEEGVEIDHLLHTAVDGGTGSVALDELLDLVVELPSALRLVLLRRRSRWRIEVRQLPPQRL